VAVTIAGMVELDQPLPRITALLLLATFAIILFTPYWHGHPMWTHIRLGALSMVTAGLMTMSPGWNFFPILFFVLAPVAITNLSLKAGLAWIGVFTVITGWVMVAFDGWVGLAILLPFAAGFVFFGVFGWLMMESDRNRLRSEQLLAELRAAHQQLQEYTARAEDLAIAQERNRIAREMHDTLGHRLTIASVQLEGAQRLIPTNPERAAAMIGVVREQVKEGLSDLRRTVAMLRASVEEDLPLDKALMRLADQVGQATALKIHLSLECPPGLSLPQQQALYRAAQEGLTNIQRHARASEAWLRLAPCDGMLELLLSDNGVGMSAEQAQAGFGLLGLKERSALHGGDFHVDARPGGGTQITFRIPLAPENPPAPAAESGGGRHE
jgi:signal transduction histidine kinase